jgi:hypothetical protein
MITNVIPKLPMRNKQLTREYYSRLGWTCGDATDYPNYLIMEWGSFELHFFLHAELNPMNNDGQVYIRTNEIKSLYQEFNDQGISIHSNAPLERKPWGMWEFSLLDPDHNLLTFGQETEI